MAYLAASILLLFCTPFLVQLVQRYARLSQALAFFMVLGISYTIFAHIILENIESFGYWAIFAALAGVLMFGFGDDYFFAKVGRPSRLFFVLMQIFLFSHAMIDGAALISTEINPTELPLDHRHTQELSLSILLHRMLFEVFIWKYFYDRFGQKIAFGVLVNIGAGTIIGFFASRALFSHMPSYFGLFEAFIGGALLHLVYDYLKERLIAAKRARL